MALRGVYDSAEDAPEPLREHLTQKDGKFHLDIEGFIPKQELDSWRSNNRALKKQADELTAKLTETETRYAGVDPDEYKTLKAAPTDVQKQIGEVETRLQKKYDEQFRLEREKTQQAEAKFHQALIANDVTLAAPSVGLHDTAIEEAQRQAGAVWRIYEGKPVPFRGEEPLYSEKEPSKFMSMPEWLGGLAKPYPHMFKSSSGGGAVGGLGGHHQNGHVVIAGSDQKAFLSNLEAIASGKVQVDTTA